MKFTEKLKYRMQEFAYGRYGYDELSRFLYALMFIFTLLSFIPNCSFFLLLSFASLVYVTFRAMSRNTAKRSLENEKYLRLTSRSRERREQRRRLKEERKYYAFFKCSGCGNLNRVPKGKGKIRMTCPKCGRQEIHKT